MPLSHIQAIAFDADDTLWVNETLFRKAEEEFCELLKGYIDADSCNRLLFEVEMKTFRFTVMASNLLLYHSLKPPFNLQTANSQFPLLKNL